MEELLLKLIEAVRKTYKDKTAADLIFRELFKNTAGSKDYKDAYEFAKRAGHDLEDSIIENWAVLMQDSEVFASTAKQLLKGVVPDMNDDILRACEQIQDNKNAAAGLRLRAQTATADEYDLNEIAERLDGKKMPLLDGELATHGCKTVDSTERANMDFAMSTGYEIKVSRTYDGVGLHRKTKHAKRCSYCLERAGTRTFKNTREVNSSGIFARHDGCGCTIDYENTSTGTKIKGVQNYKTGIKKITELRGNAESVERNLAIYTKDIQNAENITNEMLTAKKKPGEVTELNSWIIAKEKYKVDGKHVIQKHSDEEKKTAKLIADSFGGKAELIPEIKYPQNKRTPDFVLNGVTYDIKGSEGGGKHNIYDLIKPNKEQGPNFVVDTSKSKLDEKAIIQGIEEVYWSGHTSWVERIVWVHDGNIKAVFQRKK